MDMINIKEGKFNITDINMTITSAGIDTATIIIIVVVIVLVIAILVFTIIICKRRSQRKKQEEKGQIEIEIKQKQDQPKQLKQFIVHVPLDQQSNISGMKDSTLIGDKSTSLTNRKLLADSQLNDETARTSKGKALQMDMNSSFDGEGDNKFGNANIKEENMGASFREAFNKIDQPQDKIKDLLRSKYDKTFQPSEGGKEPEKNTKDIAAGNISIYSDGNREDFYSQASKYHSHENSEVVEEYQNQVGKYINDNDMDNSPEFGTRLNMNILNKGNKPVEDINNLKIERSPNKRQSVFVEKELSPREHSDIFDDDEEESKDKHYKNSHDYPWENNDSEGVRNYNSKVSSGVVKKDSKKQR
jgi:hypothetical protein